MTTKSTFDVNPPSGGSEQAGRLYYLDWLRVLAILGVFLFHAAHPFDTTD